MGGIICHTNRFIFCHIPKTGGTSLYDHVKRYFHEHKGEKIINWGHKDLTRIENYAFHDDLKEKGLSDRNFEDYFLFTIVRNPWDRLVSVHENLMKTEYHGDFGRFLEELEQKDLGHTRTAEFFLNGYKVKALRFENYVNEVKRVLSLFGIRFENYPWQNKNPRHREPYPYYYKKPWMVNLVRERYKWEIQKFGYHF